MSTQVSPAPSLPGRSVNLRQLEALFGGLQEPWR
jgi:hypothetical protein